MNYRWTLRATTSCRRLLTTFGYRTDLGATARSDENEDCDPGLEKDLRPKAAKWPGLIDKTVR